MRKPKRPNMVDAMNLQPVAAVTMRAEKPSGPKYRPHVSLYLPPKAMRLVKEIAMESDCRPHDVIVRGINKVFAEYGKPTVAELGEE